MGFHPKIWSHDVSMRFYAFHFLFIGETGDYVTQNTPGLTRRGPYANAGPTAELHMGNAEKICGG